MDQNENFENSQNEVDNSQCEETKGKEYFELVERKIRDQANRLLELQEYKKLCEERIRQLSPSQIFPLTEKCLQDVVQPPSDYHITQFNDMKSLLELREKVILLFN